MPMASITPSTMAGWEGGSQRAQHLWPSTVLGKMASWKVWAAVNGWGTDSQRGNPCLVCMYIGAHTGSHMPLGQAEQPCFPTTGQEAEAEQGTRGTPGLGDAGKEAGVWACVWKTLSAGNRRACGIRLLAPWGDGQPEGPARPPSGVEVEVEG